MSSFPCARLEKSNNTDPLHINLFIHLESLFPTNGWLQFYVNIIPNLLLLFYGL